jgi:hypothetical protein
MVIAHSFAVFKKALKGFYRGLMKYSGTTFILDNVEAKLKQQRDKNESQIPPNNQSFIDQKK